MTLGWFTKVLASTVLSPLGRCSSRANTTQLAMMVNSTAYSNGVQNNWIKKKYTNNVILLIETRSRRKKYTPENVIYFFLPGFWLYIGHITHIINNMVLKKCLNKIVYTKWGTKTKVEHKEDFVCTNILYVYYDDTKLVILHIVY